MKTETTCLLREKLCVVEGAVWNAAFWHNRRATMPQLPGLCMTVWDVWTMCWEFFLFRVCPFPQRGSETSEDEFSKPWKRRRMLAGLELHHLFLCFAPPNEPGHSS